MRNPPINLFIDPTGRVIKKAVFINASGFAPYIYEHETIDIAIKNKKLPEHISKDLNSFLKPALLCQSLIDLVNKDSIDSIVLREQKGDEKDIPGKKFIGEVYRSPISLGFPVDPAVTSTIDGQTYNLVEFMKWISTTRNTNTPTGIPNNREDYKFAYFLDPIIQQMGEITNKIKKETMASGQNSIELDLTKIFHQWQQTEPQFFFNDERAKDSETQIYEAVNKCLLVGSLIETFLMTMVFSQRDTPFLLLAIMCVSIFHQSLRRTTAEKKYLFNDFKWRDPNILNQYIFPIRFLTFVSYSMHIISLVEDNLHPTKQTLILSFFMCAASIPTILTDDFIRKNSFQLANNAWETTRLKKIYFIGIAFFCLNHTLSNSYDIIKNLDIGILPFCFILPKLVLETATILGCVAHTMQRRDHLHINSNNLKNVCHSLLMLLISLLSNQSWLSSISAAIFAFIVNGNKPGVISALLPKEHSPDPSQLFRITPEMVKEPTTLDRNNPESSIDTDMKKSQ